MPDVSTLVFFAVAAVALLIVPGPVVLYTVARSVDQGLKAGLASTVAVGLGDLCHVLAATQSRRHSAPAVPVRRRLHRAGADGSVRRGRAPLTSVAPRPDQQIHRRGTALRMASRRGVTMCQQADTW